MKIRKQCFVCGPDFGGAQRTRTAHLNTASVAL